MPTPPRPSPELISRYWDKREKLENYRVQEKSLNLLFGEFCPENKAIEHILLKVSALNSFYSTNIFDTFTVAKHILGKDIDSRLKQNDCALVNELAWVMIKGKQRNFYSFASKYCSHHSPNHFPIYDSFVEKMLLHYRKADKFDTFETEDLKSYERFVTIIERFRTHYDLKAFSLRQIDVFLWLAGKDYFPASYGSAKKRHAAQSTNASEPGTLSVADGAGGSKYGALREYLEKQISREVTLQFKDFTKVLGFSLPPSAFKYQAFWANQSNTHNRPWAKAWQEAGYEVVSYRLSNADGWVRFRRRES